ncbi:MAG: glutathione S-transferase family protein [Aestuariivirgaceae bacterium]
MATLLHYPLDPFSRRIRLQLSEYGLEVELTQERPWEQRPGFLHLSPSGMLPVYIDDDKTVASGIEAVSEYLEELRAGFDNSLIGTTPGDRAEARRLAAWFDGKFHYEVGGPVLMEKVIRRFLPPEAGGGAPNMNRVRSGLGRIRQHLEYIGMLAEARNWLAGDKLTIADLAAAAHLSCIDYLGDVPWSGNEAAKTWYQRIKSRPSFRPLLADHVRGITPPRAYADLDF